MSGTLFRLTFPDGVNFTESFELTVVQNIRITQGGTITQLDVDVNIYKDSNQGQEIIASYDNADQAEAECYVIKQQAAEEAASKYSVGVVKRLTDPQPDDLNPPLPE